MESARAPTTEVPARGGAQLAPGTLDGWYVFHQLFRVDWPALKALDDGDRSRLTTGLSNLLDRWSSGASEGWSGAYGMVGGGVDLMLLHFRPTIEEAGAAGRAFALAEAADFMDLDHDYLSIVELGLYALTVEVAGRVDPADHEAYRAALDEALEAQREKDYVRRRLNPIQPENMPYVCYYPMDKRRDKDANWYSLPIETRSELMQAHGAVGRRFAGRISQVISGSLGLADWEWAVTLWAADPLRFKEIVTEMRYDEASAEYAEFGRFFVGRRLSVDGLRAFLSTDEETG
ncbi:MAG: heme-dependent peroxidase [Gemmatimonadota bacterium]|nr:heme-dependent peroxidase [Gemmatimonadota bacterium]